MLELNKIYCGDNIELIKQLDDNSIDMVITSPPYDNLRTYNKNEDIFNFDKFKILAKEMYRVIKEGSIIVWVVGDATINGCETLTSFKQAIYFKDECGFNIHDIMIYQKFSVCYTHKNRYTNVFEYMFIISKGIPKTVNLIKDKKNSLSGKYRSGNKRQKDGSLIPKTNTRQPINEYGVRGNIWLYNTGNNKSTKDKIAFQHPAIYPEKLVNDHIISWSNKDYLILDPFMGSGTTAKMCILNQRNFIGYEINKEYVDIAEKRIQIAYKEIDSRLFK